MARRETLTACLPVLVVCCLACSEGRDRPQCEKNEDCKSGRCLQGRCVALADAGAEAGVPELGAAEAGLLDQLPPRDLARAERPLVDGKPALDQAPLDQKLDSKKDLGAPDQPGPDGPPPSCLAVLGKPCTASGQQCAAGGSAASCLLTSGTAGVCSCTCTPDNPSTPASEDSCPQAPQNVCLAVELSSGQKQSFCFHSCRPMLGANDCQPGVACDPRSATLTGKIGKAVCLYPACQSNLECPVVTKVSCDTKTPSLTCTTGETCVPLTSATTTGRCAKAGLCDQASGLCNAHALGSALAKVGDPCTDDTQCGGKMYCQLELDLGALAKKGGASCASDAECCSEVCQSGTCATGLCTVRNRNGYCAIKGCAFADTLPLRACPGGSLCNRLFPGGLCQRTCSLLFASDCRGNPGDLLGDYECRAWNNLSIGGQLVTDGPVCDFGPGMTCDLLKASGIDCTKVGDHGGTIPNPTSMSCRGLDGKGLTDPYSPLGFCLDDTSSGTQLRSPLPTP